MTILGFALGASEGDNDGKTQALSAIIDRYYNADGAASASANVGQFYGYSVGSVHDSVNDCFQNETVADETKIAIGAGILGGSLAGGTFGGPVGAIEGGAVGGVSGAVRPCLIKVYKDLRSALKSKIEKRKNPYQ